MTEKLLTGMLNVNTNKQNLFLKCERYLGYSKLIINFFFFFFFLNSVLRPFQDYFSSYEMSQSVGGAKPGEAEKNHLAHPQAELGLSHLASAGLEPTPDTQQ